MPMSKKLLYDCNARSELTSATETATTLAYTANALNQYSEILGEAVSNRVMPQ